MSQYVLHFRRASLNISDEIQKRFWEHLMSKHGGHFSVTKINLKAAALFDAIQDAFSVDSVASHRGLKWMTDPDMVGMLAACAWVGLTCSENEEIDWDAHDFVLTRTFRGFIRTLVVAIRRDGIRTINGTVYLRGFSIPEWFIQWTKNLPEEIEFYPSPEEFVLAIDH